MQNQGQVIILTFSLPDGNHGLIQAVPTQNNTTNVNTLPAPVVDPSTMACEKYRSEVSAASAKIYCVSSALEPYSSLDLSFNRIPENGCQKKSLLLIHPVLKFSCPEARKWLPMKRSSERYEVQDQVENLTKVTIRRMVAPPQLKTKKPVKRLTNSASTPKSSKQKPKPQTQGAKTPRGKAKPDICPNEWLLFTQPVLANTFEEYMFWKKTQIVQPESTVKPVEITNTTASASVNNMGQVQCTTCGHYSANHSFCDSCKRSIPKDAKIVANCLEENSSGMVSDALTETANCKKRSHSTEHDDKESADHKRPKLSDSVDQMETCRNQNTTTVPTQTCIISTVAPPVSLTETVQEENVKRVVQNLLSGQAAEPFVELQCNTIWFGNYKGGEELKYKKFRGIVTSVGVLLRLEPAAGDGALELVIPSPSVLFLGTTMEATSYLIMRVGNTMSKKISNLLGLNDVSQPRFSYGSHNATKLGSEDVSQTRFSSASPNPAEQNIVLYPQSFTKKVKQKLIQIFGDRWIAFTQANAYELAQKVIPKNLGATLNLAQKLVTPSRPNGFILPSAKKIELASKSALGAEDKNTTPKLSTFTYIRPTISATIAGKTIFRKGTFTLTGKDITTLWPEQFLNDQIIDFWLDYVQKSWLSEEDRMRTHIFSTFFYTRLTQKDNIASRIPAGAKPPSAAEKRHSRVVKWTKKFDIFSKDFIIVPINENYHWYVAIICFAGLDGPKWLSDGTDVKDWCNVGSKNKRPIYNLLPGMMDRTDDLPKQRKAELQNLIEKGIVETVKKDPFVQENLQINGEGDASASTLTSNLACKAGLTQSIPLKPDTQQSQLNNSSVILKISSSNAQGKCVVSASVPKIVQKDEEEPDDIEDVLFEDYFVFEDEHGDGETQTKDLPSETSPKLDVEQQSVNCAPAEGSKTQNMSILADKVSDTAGRTDFRIRQPCILLFDSHKDFSKSKVFNTLREYLRMEYKVRKGVERDFTRYTMPGFSVNCPQQGNFYDCGLYLLQCVEQFFKTPISSYHLALPYSLRNWFPPLNHKRKEIFEVIRELTKNANPENLEVLKCLDPSLIKIPTLQNNMAVASNPSPNCESQKSTGAMEVNPPSPSAFVTSESEVKRRLESVSAELIPLPPGTCFEAPMPATDTDAIKDVIPPPCETLEEKVKVDHNYMASESDFEEISKPATVHTALGSPNPNSVNDRSSELTNCLLETSSTEPEPDMHSADVQSDSCFAAPVASETTL